MSKLGIYLKQKKKERQKESNVAQILSIKYNRNKKLPKTAIKYFP